MVEPVSRIKNVHGIYAYSFSKDCQTKENSSFGIYSWNVHVVDFWKMEGVKSVLLSAYMYIFNVLWK